MKNYALTSLLAIMFFFCAPVWTQSFIVPIRVTDGINELDLRIGIHPDGTNDYDSGLDQFAPPPPPAGVFDARLVFFNESYYTDIRDNTLSSKVFHLNYRPSSGKEIVLYWNSDTLFRLGQFFLTDGITGELFSLDMLKIDSVKASSVAVISNQANIIFIPYSPSLMGEKTPRATSSESVTCWPNPFNSEIQISYRLSSPGPVSLCVYDINANKILVIVDSYKSSGDHKCSLNMRSLSSGCYFCVLRTQKAVRVTKIISIR